ncbi:MAG: pyrroloquinoline quinone biosynthesis protein PqqE [Verrucomicrobia bacterium]|nr:MAG: pyrroloquinoline quinone biosynthesis protein PqqE [Verrucomicrobiota bacterium]
MTAPRPYALLAEITYRCPLHCPYCSNPVAVACAVLSGEQARQPSSALRTAHATANNGELSTDEWRRVIREAAALGVLQIGFSGGEPLVRRDLAELVRAAREANVYTNLITSGIGLDDDRVRALRDAGLDSVQLSFQSDEADLADEIAGARGYERKLDAAAKIRAAGIPLSLNFVIHRRNIDRLPQMIELAETLGAQRVELANVQFYGWAFLNRAALLPTREQVDRAREIATAAKARLSGRIDIFYVLPDYYETRPKPCLNGWGQRYLTVNPIGDALPCPTASSAIPDMRFENIRARDLDWIWRESESFNRFRGTDWMPEPCRSCPQREIDFGGCRCQAALLTSNAANTDPVCTLSANRAKVDAMLRVVNSARDHACEWIYRENPKTLPGSFQPRGIMEQRRSG